MSKKQFAAVLCIIFFFGLVQNSFAQEPVPGEESGFVVEEEVLPEPQREGGFIVEEETLPEPQREGGFIVEEETLPEPREDAGFIIEEEIFPGFQNVYDNLRINKKITGFNSEQDKIVAHYITADVLTPMDVKPAINYYINSDITRKFTGLIINVKLEKIYGIIQENKEATVYFDYRYNSMRNMENVLYEKGKMTFMKFNSGRWFNAELSIFLMDSYFPEIEKKLQTKEE